MKIFKDISNILIPSKCIFCQNSTIESYFANTCDYCYEEMKNFIFISPDEIVLPDSKVFYFSKYTGIIKELIHRLKFQKQLKLLPVIKSLYTDKINNLLEDIEADLIIYIPVHYIKKLFIRGFDQNEELLKVLLSKNQKYKTRKVLRRRKYTKPLYNLSLQQRQKELKNAFYLSNIHYIPRNHIVIFDDIYTSGTTINEAVKEISIHNPLKISIISLCHGY